MAWEGSTRKETLPPNWQQLRRIVLDRCGGRCEVVKKNGKRCWDKATDVDHMGDRLDHSVERLRGICTWHHSRKSSREGNEAQAAQRAVLRHPVEPHPGLIQGPPRPPKNKGF